MLIPFLQKYFGIQTNLDNINAKEILNTYRGLWQVEQTFRIAKSNLEIRPVFHYNTDRIRAHFLICYMSLALIRYAGEKIALNKYLKSNTSKERQLSLFKQGCIYFRRLFRMVHETAKKLIEAFYSLVMKNKSASVIIGVI